MWLNLTHSLITRQPSSCEANPLALRQAEVPHNPHGSHRLDRARPDQDALRQTSVRSALSVSGERIEAFTYEHFLSLGNTLHFT